MSLKNIVLAVVGMMFMATAAVAAEPIKIGIFLPLTGQNAFGGQLELEGVQLAHKLYPTILGHPVELITVDNKSDKVEAANAVTRLISRDRVTGVIGSYGSSLAMAGAEVAEREKTPGIGTSCTNPLVTAGKKYYFRACFIDPYQASGAATYAMETLGAKKAAILRDVANDYAIGLATFFKQSFEKQGGEIISNLNYNSGDQDFSAQLTEIISKNPDVVFIPAYFAEGAIIMKQARELGATFRIMGADAMDNPDTVKLAGEAANGFLHTTFPYDVNMPEMTKEAAEFTEAWNKYFPEKEPNVNSVLGYTSYMMFVEAMTKAGTVDDKEAITKALGELEGVSTPLGMMTINKNHDAEFPIGIIEIIDGKRVYLGEVKPAE